MLIWPEKMYHQNGQSPPPPKTDMRTQPRTPSNPQAYSAYDNEKSAHGGDEPRGEIFNGNEDLHKGLSQDPGRSHQVKRSSHMPMVHQRWIDELAAKAGKFITANTTVGNMIWEFRGIVTEVSSEYMILEDRRLGSRVIVPLSIINFIDVPIEPIAPGGGLSGTEGQGK